MDDESASISDEDFITLNAIRVEALYNNGTIPAFVTMLGALVVIFSFWDESLNNARIIWLSSLAIVTCGRFFCVKTYHSSEKPASEYPFWLNIYFIGVLCSGSIFGSAIYIFITEGNIIHIHLLTMFFLILLAGSIGIFSVFQRIYYGFNLPLILPLIFFLLSRDDEKLNTLGSLVIILVIFIFVIQLLSHRIINQLLMVKLDNKNLLNTYEVDRERINILERLFNTKAKQVKELRYALKVCRLKLDQLTQNKD
jgi:hypothetical protein